MPFRASKTLNDELLRYGDFRGGLNLSVAEEALQPNELAQADNVELDPLTGGLKIRGGLRKLKRLRGSGNDFILSGSGHNLYRRDYSSRKLFSERIRDDNDFDELSKSQQFNGTGTIAPEISVTSWTAGQENNWTLVSDLIGVGTDIYMHTPGQVSPILHAKGGISVFTWGGRVGAAYMDGVIYFSAIGDAFKWTNEPNNLSSAQFLNVGYKDGQVINAIVPLGQDLIVFKGFPLNTKGECSIWRVSGYIPNTTVTRIATGISAAGQSCVCDVGNDVFFLSARGVASLSGVMEYGSVKLSWFDAKVSEVMRGNALWHMRTRGQLWCRDETRNIVWVFHYKEKMWTRFVFPMPIAYACEALVKDSYELDTCIVLSGGDVCILDDAVGTDYGATEPIQARVRCGAAARTRQILVKGVGVSYFRPGGSQMRVRVSAENAGAFSTDLPQLDRAWYASEDTRPAYGNNSSVAGSHASGSARYRCLVRGWSVTPEVLMKGPGCTLRGLSMEVAEV